MLMHYPTFIRSFCNIVCWSSRSAIANCWCLSVWGFSCFLLFFPVPCTLEQDFLNGDRTQFNRPVAGGATINRGNSVSYVCIEGFTLTVGGVGIESPYERVCGPGPGRTSVFNRPPPICERKFWKRPLRKWPLTVASAKMTAFEQMTGSPCPFPGGLAFIVLISKNVGMSCAKEVMSFELQTPFMTPQKGLCCWLAFLNDRSSYSTYFLTKRGWVCVHIPVGLFSG